MLAKRKFMNNPMMKTMILQGFAAFTQENMSDYLINAQIHFPSSMPSPSIFTIITFSISYPLILLLISSQRYYNTNLINSSVMSLFLLHPGQTDKIILKKYQPQIQNLQLPTNTTLCSSSQPQSTKSTTFCEESPKEMQSKEYQMVVRTLLDSYKISARIREDRPRRETKIDLTLITPNELQFKVANTRGLTQLSAKVNRELNNFKLWMIKIAFHSSTGAMRMHLPVYHDFSNFQTARGQSLSEFINKHHITPYLRLFEVIIKEGSGQISSSHFQSYMKIRSLENVFRYQEMMHVYNHFNESRLETEQEGNVSLKMKRESISRTVDNKVAVQEWLASNNLGLYQYRALLNNLLPKKEKDFIIQEQELKYIRTMIAMPTQPRHRNPYENLMVLNHIYVHDILNLRLNKINQGGFSSIYLTEIKYFYVYSAEQHQLMHPSQLDGETTKKMLHKYVIIKKQEEECVYRRNPHELKVLSMIKNGSSIFLPKYYIIVNKVNPHASSVVMDFIPSKTLKEYMHSTASSISLTTKLYLIFSIIQALRYIRDYRIVHLDLKPNNIMIYCNMLVKLIDFGESYHHQVCIKKHQPGYTIPYSPPQIFKKSTTHYSAKSDIFSLGVLIFQMLYGIYPYDIFESTEKVDEIMEEYLKKWYFTPEEYENYGDPTVLRILNGIVSKCLAPDPMDRPELDLVALVIRQCFELLQ